MAGIGFVLKKLIRQDDLLGGASAYMHSALISCGPWVFTIIALEHRLYARRRQSADRRVPEFSGGAVLQLRFFLIFSAPCIWWPRAISPIVFTSQNITNISSSLLVCLTIVVPEQAVPVGWFYFYHVQLPLPLRLLAVVNPLSSIWIINVYLTALKNYMTTTRAFAIGMFLVLYSHVAWCAAIMKQGGRAVRVQYGWPLSCFR